MLGRDNRGLRIPEHRDAGYQEPDHHRYLGDKRYVAGSRPECRVIGSSKDRRCGKEIRDRSRMGKSEVHGAIQAEQERTK